MANLRLSDPKRNPKVIQDLSYRLEALENGIAPLVQLIEAKIQRIEAASPGYEYAQRELEALLPALEAVEQFRDEMLSLYFELADAYLQLKPWDERFRETYQLAQKFSRILDMKLALEHRKNIVS